MTRLLGVLLFVACAKPPQPPPELTPAHKAEIQDAITAGRRARLDYEQQRATAIAAAKSPSSAPCEGDFSSHIPPPRPLVETPAYPTDYAEIVWPPEERREPGFDGLFDFEERQMKERLTKPLGPREVPDVVVAEAKLKFGLPKRAAVRLVLSIDSLTRPRRAPKSKFTPGALRGTLYVYDAAEKQVRCAAPVSATSSQLIGSDDFGSQLKDVIVDGQLMHDLVMNALRLGTTSLRALPPAE